MGRMAKASISPIATLNVNQPNDMEQKDKLVLQ